MSDDEVKKDAVVEEVVEESSAKEPKTPEAPKEEVSEHVVVPKEFKALIEQVENMTVLQLHELVKTLEKKFGVSAQAVAAAGPAAAGDAGVEEQSEFTVHLAAAGETKIQVIKAIKELLGLGLKDAKDMVDGAPIDVKAGVKKEEAEEMKTKLVEAGASVDLN